MRTCHLARIPNPTLAACAAALLLFLPNAGAAADAAAPASAAEVSPERWEAHIVVTDGSTEARASFGVRPNATAGFDRTWDVPAQLGLGVDAYFFRPVGRGARTFARDIVGRGAAASFPLQISNVGRGKRVRISWDLRFVPAGCRRVDLWLTNAATGERIDMRLADTYELVVREPRHLLQIESTVHESALPLAPEGLAARRIAKGHVELGWQAPAGDESVVAYHVFREDGEGRVERLSEDPIYETSFIDVDGAASLGGHYSVRAVNIDMCAGSASKSIAVAPSRRMSGRLREALRHICLLTLPEPSKPMPSAVGGKVDLRAQLGRVCDKGSGELQLDARSARRHSRLLRAWCRRAEREAGEAGRGKPFGRLGRGSVGAVAGWREICGDVD